MKMHTIQDCIDAVTFMRNNIDKICLKLKENEVKNFREEFNAVSASSAMVAGEAGAMDTLSELYELAYKRGYEVP